MLLLCRQSECVRQAHALHREQALDSNPSIDAEADVETTTVQDPEGPLRHTGSSQ